MESINNETFKRIKQKLFIMFAVLLIVLAIAFSKNSNIAFAADTQNQSAHAVNTTSYNLEDNTGYVVKSNSSKVNPLGGNLSSIYIDVNTTTGNVKAVGTRIVNGKPVNQYGVVVGNGEITDNAIVDIKLKFNKTLSYQTNGDHAGETKIENTSAGDTGWFLSDDSARSVDRFENIGVINSGALILAKSYDGIDWTWQRDGFVDEYKNNFHTTDFITGGSTSGYGFADAYGMDKFSIYTPSGKDISRGVYIKILLAYEIKYATYSYRQGGFLWLERIKETTWHYRNILEESIFYLASNSATVAFTNASDDNPLSSETSEIVSQAGTILDGHGTLKGFRLNKLNNASFTVKYRHVKPNATPTNVWVDAYDGQMFSETGRYDFEIITSLGDKYKNPDTNVEHYSVYVNNLDVNGAVNLYFGNPMNLTEPNFITSDSTRVFSMEDDIPVYVAGQTYYKVNAVNPAYMTVAGKIYKDGDRDNPVKIFNGSYAQAAGTITEPGYYEAEFYSNKDYSATMSGDAYHFIFKFKVIDAANAPEPTINKQLLESIITASDLQGSYYSVAVPTLGVGKAIFAFGNYSTAYGFAYEYERGKVVATPDGYTYRGQDYVSQFDVLDKVDEYSNDLVVKRYFDASDLNSFLTISDVVDDVTQINVSKDIIVFSNDTVQQAMRSGEPFLNDRKVRTLNSDGSITETVIPFKFIQIADFESNSVVLTHIDTSKSHTISYNVGVEQQLQAVNAPSGRYKITETTKGGVKTEYYAIYIKTGDIAASIEIDKFYNGELTTKEYTNRDNNLSTMVNGFLLKGAANAHDGQTIVKIEKNGNQVFIGTIDEVTGQVFTAEGNYTVTVLDRLGNSYKLYFNIYIEAASSVITFDNDGTIETKTVFDGQTIPLSTPSKAGFVFKGWSDGTAIYNDIYTVNGSVDRTLAAIWHFPSVAISLYDGALYNTFTNNVEDVRTLPFLTREGYEFQGWFASFGDGTGRFYYGQITSVPNTASFRLDAIWKKTTGDINPQTGSNGQSKITLVNGNNIQPITADYGSTAILPNATQEGMIFFGWQYVISGNNGIIYTAGKIESVPNTSQIVLHALFKTDSNYVAPTGAEQNDNGIGAGITTGDGSGSVGGGVRNNVFANLFNKDVLGGITSILFILVALLFLYGFALGKKRQGTMNGVAFADTNNTAKQTSVKVKPVKVYAINQYEQSAKQYNLYKKAQRAAKFQKDIESVEITPRRGWWKIAVPVICSVMVLVMGGHFLMQQLIPVVAYHRQEKAIQVQIDKQLEEYDNMLSATPKLDPKYDLNTVNATSQSLASISKTFGAEEEIDGQTNESGESFLIACVFLDLVSFGHDVFPSTINIDGETIKGLAYTGHTIYKEEAGKKYYESGFVILPNEDELQMLDWEENDIIITPIEQDENNLNNHYVLTFMETYVSHYIYNQEYIMYELGYYFTVDYYAQENEISNYDLSLGKIFDYDLGRTIYDPDLGYSSPNLSAMGLNSYTDYEMAMNMFRSYITTQNNNGLEVNTLNSVYISLAAYNEMLLNEQDESFLGLSPEDIYEFESDLTHKEFYYVTPDGELHKAEFPPPPPGKPGFWSRFAVFATAIASIAVGIVIICVTLPCGGPANPAASMLAGAFFGVGLELFSQGLSGKGIEEVNWLKVGVAAVAGALSAIPGVGMIGAGFISGGLYAAESIWENRDNLNSIDGWLNVGLDFLNGFQRGMFIHSIATTPLICFVAGTGVSTIEGIKAIETIRKGDLVVSHNDTTSVVEYNAVKQLFVNETKELTKLKFSNDDEIISTPTHPYFVVNLNRYIDAKNLRAGDVLRTVNGETVVVEQVQHEILERPVAVYNFEVENNHNYFVGNSSFNDFVLVHNQCGANALPRPNTGAGLGELVQKGLGALGQLKLGLLDQIALTMFLDRAIAQDQTIAQVRTNRDDKTERHHIVARTTMLAEGSRLILEQGAGISRDDPKNLVDLPYARHKHLHTHLYHAKVFNDMLEAMNRAAEKLNINKFDANSYINTVKNLTLKASEYKKAIDLLKNSKEFKEYIGEFAKNPAAQEELKREVEITLATIETALRAGTYMPGMV